MAHIDLAVSALQQLLPLLGLDNGLLVDALQSRVLVVVGVGEVDNDIIGVGGLLPARPGIVVIVIMIVVAAGPVMMAEKAGIGLSASVRIGIGVSLSLGSDVRRQQEAGAQEANGEG